MVIWGSKQGGAGGGNMASSLYAVVAGVGRPTSSPPMQGAAGQHTGSALRVTRGTFAQGPSSWRVRKERNPVCPSTMMPLYIRPTTATCANGGHPPHHLLPSLLPSKPP